MNGRTVSGKKTGQSGFTIVETLIVLAVTSAMFLSAAFLINGRQRQTSFNQAIRNIQSELQQTAGEVGSGYYSNPGTFSCQMSANRPLLKIAATAQGTNKDCIFLGKALQFGETGNQDFYNVYTIVGLRGSTSTAGIDLAAAAPRLLARSSSDAATVPDVAQNVFETKRLLYGLSISQAYYTRSGNTAKAFLTVGFVSGVNGNLSADTSQAANALFVPGSGLNRTRPAAVKGINDALLLTGTASAPKINPASGIQLCFNSGGTKQSGLITVGGAGRLGSAVNLRIFDNQDCL